MEDVEDKGKQQMEKPKIKKGNKAVPIVIGVLALGMMAFAIYNITQKESPKKTPSVRQVVQATQQQVEAVKQEASKLEMVDKVEAKPFSQIGENQEHRDIWDELRREAEREQRDKSQQVDSQGELKELSPQVNHDDITNTLKVNLDGGAEKTERRIYTASKKEQLETEKEEYQLERTSMFAYSSSYEKAAYIEKDAAVVQGNSVGDSVHKLLGPDDPSGGDIEPQKRLLYNNNPSFLIGIGDILDAVLTHKIVSDTKDSPVICSVSKDLLTDKGEWVLIPSGARVIGRAAQVNGIGANRLFIYFQKIVLPNGVPIDLPPIETVGLDTEGSLGVVSSVDRHFLLKFGTAFLVGLLDGLGGFAQSSMGRDGGASYFVDRSSSNFKEVNSEILQQYGNIPPTITIRPGHRMKIYFPRTIEISGYVKANNRAYGRVK